MYDGMRGRPSLYERALPARTPVLGRAATLLESVVNWARLHSPKGNASGMARGVLQATYRA